LRSSTTWEAFPGTTRAALQTLVRAWSADIDLDNPAFPSARVADIALLERRIRNALPHGAMLPRQLRDAALERFRLLTTRVFWRKRSVLQSTEVYASEEVLMAAGNVRSPAIGNIDRYSLASLELEKADGCGGDVGYPEVADRGWVAAHPEGPVEFSQRQERPFAADKRRSQGPRQTSADMDEI